MSALNPRIFFAGVLGFASGLPLALSGATLQAWLTTEGMSLEAIAWFSLAGMPYTWKFLWAPVLDRYAPPRFDRRRGWMVMFQVILALAMATIAFIPLPQGLPFLAGMAILVAAASASQDIVIDAWRTEILWPAERGLGAAAAVAGYRIGMLVSGALALIFADHFGWQMMWALFSGFFFVLPLLTLLAPESNVRDLHPRTFKDAWLGPLTAFFSRDGALLFLALIVLYKLSDAFATSLSTTFLLRGLGFSLTEVGVVNKMAALGASIGGAFLGGWGVSRFGLRSSLLLFGVMQSLAALGFYALALVGHDWPLMVFAVLMEHLTSGMGTAAFAALLMSLCDLRYSATQFALLSAVSAVGRVYVGPSSAYLVDALGWPHFFLFSLGSGLPGLVMLGLLWNRLQDFLPNR